MSYFVLRPEGRERWLLVLLFVLLFGTLWIEPVWARVAIGSVGLAVSFSLTWKLYELTLKYYQALIRGGLDPFGVSYYAEYEVPTSSLPRPLIAFYGDSRAQCWTPPQRPLPFDFVNRSIAGQTTTQVLHRLPIDVLRLRPEVIVLQVGINDLKCMAFFRQLERLIIEECKSNIRKIVAQSVDAGATVILTTIFPIGRIPLYRRPFWTEAIRDAVREVNRDLVSLASDRVLIFDSYSLLQSDDRVAAPYALDPHHINEAGYAHLNSHLVELLVKTQKLASSRAVGRTLSCSPTVRGEALSS